MDLRQTLTMDIHCQMLSRMDEDYGEDTICLFASHVAIAMALSRWDVALGSLPQKIKEKMVEREAVCDVARSLKSQ